MEKRLNSIPVVPMRGIVALPGESIRFEVGREVSLRAVDTAMESGSGILLLCQKDASRTMVNRDSMYSVGAYCEITNMKNTDNGIRLIIAKAVARASVIDFLDNNGYFSADIIRHEDDLPCEEQQQSLKNILMMQVNALLSVKQVERSMADRIRETAYEDCTRYPDALACFFTRTYETKQAILECIDLNARYDAVCKLIIDERKFCELEQSVEQRTREQIDKNQKEYYLREKIVAIKKELGDDSDAELIALRERAKNKNLPDFARERLEKELRRLESLPMGSHEAPTTRGLIECILDLPWSEKSEDTPDTVRAKEILDRDHYGLDKVKKRIIEYIAVGARTGNLSGQIICLVGPPGVGKTSISSCIAEAVGRNFVRMSLGGIDDEAEIRGHRRTYIGAMPGRIITAMRQAKTVNPVILFDEIDKLNKNVHGDPAAAMLEVLDSAQNSTFRDHYLEIPYDLSQVMFITTANSTDTIPRPLLDRMEVIEVPGYLEYEKVQIAEKHLIPKQFQKHGIKPRELTFSEDSIVNIVRHYTRESGVRNLERTIAAVCRNAACELSEGKKALSMTQNRIVNYLGAPKYSFEKSTGEALVGVVNGLAWTSVGGETLTVEVLTIPEGSGKLELTGKLGDVMQESAHAAYTYVRANAHAYGVNSDFFKTHDIHVHVPEGAVPKDGPSAGITLMTALMSAITGIPVRENLAMTGEITLRGRVLKIGGLREKLLAAIRAGIATALVPEDNKSDVEEMESAIREQIKVIYVSDANSVLHHALISKPSVPQAKMHGRQNTDVVTTA